MNIQSFDKRRNIVIPGDKNATIAYCVEHFLQVGRQAIDHHGYFAVALAGGSTPKAMYQELAKREKALDWERATLFWGDERSVSPDHPESNYRMAMEAGLNQLPILPSNIFRMKAEKNIEEAAKVYEHKLPEEGLDMVMLGMGEDGHTASLFPKTSGLHAKDRLVIANYVPEKETWRMSLTFEAINAADTIVFYVLGKSKAAMVKRIFNSEYDPDQLPVQKIGTEQSKALWVLDQDAASEL